MSQEMFWLILTALMTSLFWVPYVLNRMAVRGIVGSMANPSSKLKAQPAWAERSRHMRRSGRSAFRPRRIR